MYDVYIQKDNADEIKDSFLSEPFLKKIKTPKSYRWHSDCKYWRVPNIDGTLEKLLKIHEGEEIYLDHTLQSGDSPVIVNDKVPKQSKIEDFFKEHASGIYCCETVKEHFYFNIDFLNFVCKTASRINNNNIKEHPVYFSKEKVSTSTLNHIINALKFYYDTIPKKSFV